MERKRERNRNKERERKSERRKKEDMQFETSKFLLSSFLFPSFCSSLSFSIFFPPTFFLSLITNWESCEIREEFTSNTSTRTEREKERRKKWKERKKKQYQVILLTTSQGMWTTKKKKKKKKELEQSLRVSNVWKYQSIKSNKAHSWAIATISFSLSTTFFSLSLYPLHQFQKKQFTDTCSKSSKTCVEKIFVLEQSFPFSLHSSFLFLSLSFSLSFSRDHKDISKKWIM